MSFPVVPNDFKDVVPAPTSTMCDKFTKVLLQLPVLVWKLVNFMLDGDGNLTDAFKLLISDITLRAGDLIFSAAPLDETGRLLCNGTAVSRTTYASLFAKIGTTYGAGNTTTTFNLPDYRSKFPIGAGTLSVAATGGSDNVTLSSSNMPPHTHGVKLRNSGAGGIGQTYADLEFANPDTENETIQTTSTGGTGTPAAATPFNIIPPYVACYIYVKT